MSALPDRDDGAYLPVAADPVRLPGGRFEGPFVVFYDAGPDFFDDLEGFALSFEDWCVRDLLENYDPRVVNSAGEVCRIGWDGAGLCFVGPVGGDEDRAVLRDRLAAYVAENGAEVLP